MHFLLPHCEVGFKYQYRWLKEQVWTMSVIMSSSVTFPPRSCSWKLITVTDHCSPLTEEWVHYMCCNTSHKDMTQRSIAAHHSSSSQLSLELPCQEAERGYFLRNSQQDSYNGLRCYYVRPQCTLVEIIPTEIVTDHSYPGLWMWLVVVMSYFKACLWIMYNKVMAAPCETL